MEEEFPLNIEQFLQNIARHNYIIEYVPIKIYINMCLLSGGNY